MRIKIQLSSKAPNRDRLEYKKGGDRDGQVGWSSSGMWELLFGVGSEIVDVVFVNVEPDDLV